jgi:hypothetical protein
LPAATDQANDGNPKLLVDVQPYGAQSDFRSVTEATLLLSAPSDMRTRAATSGKQGCASKAPIDPLVANLETLGGVTLGRQGSRTRADSERLHSGRSARPELWCWRRW